MIGAPFLDLLLVVHLGVRAGGRGLVRVEVEDRVGHVVTAAMVRVGWVVNEVFVELPEFVGMRAASDGYLGGRFVVRS